jgi:hypothetical protein
VDNECNHCNTTHATNSTKKSCHLYKTVIRVSAVNKIKHTNVWLEILVLCGWFIWQSSRYLDDSFSTGVPRDFPKCAMMILTEVRIYEIKYKYIRTQSFPSLKLFKFILADPSGRAVSGVGLRPSACWDRGFESHQGHGCLSCTVCVVR